jgi:DNA-directed RNA polymerase subunit omega
MARITVEDCLTNIENRFILVHMAHQRTLQLLKGITPQVNAPENREVVIALREIAANNVYLDDEQMQNLKEGGFISSGNNQ